MQMVLFLCDFLCRDVMQLANLESGSSQLSSTIVPPRVRARTDAHKHVDTLICHSLIRHRLWPWLKDVLRVEWRRSEPRFTQSKTLRISDARIDKREALIRGEMMSEEPRTRVTAAVSHFLTVGKAQTFT